MSVVVLGLHRSGTSALTRCVNLMGLSVGRDEDLLPANEENPRGFWENTYLDSITYDILDVVGTRGHLKCRDLRFIEDDLLTLCELGLLRLDVKPGNVRFFWITRAGATLGG